MSDYPWGDTCPLLKIAKQYAVPYALTLALADLYLYGRPLPSWIGDEIVPQLGRRYLVVMEPVNEVARRMRDLKAGRA